MEIATIKRKITMVEATPLDEKYLDLGNYNCLPMITSRIYNNEGTKFEFSESRNRPDLFQMVDAAGYSFPSGHAMVSLCFYGMLAFLAAKRMKNINSLDEVEDVLLQNLKADSYFNGDETQLQLQKAILVQLHRLAVEVCAADGPRVVGPDQIVLLFY